MSQPIYSSDDFQADKHKTERFLHEGRPAIATVYAPVTYPPSPVLAFDTQSGTPRLAFTGAPPLPLCRFNLEAHIKHNVHVPGELQILTFAKHPDLGNTILSTCSEDCLLLLQAHCAATIRIAST